MGNGISRCLFEKCLRKRVLSEHLKVIEELKIPMMVVLALVLWALLSLLLLHTWNCFWEMRERRFRADGTAAADKVIHGCA
ncbi:hypothetical protein GRF29_185g341457 [Pseudopithomyces chartarum]|uniref:Uncharacterized protein n=1 Tax=Pseudopithomyces chartarum TaxID=1892770 RepID=A0AAN6LNG8_9PLEO|nr:hypothetical protein GRF29_185g341457 [Pseudopithomyces chartarum]